MSGIIDTGLMSMLGFLPGVGAAVLSVRNWLEIRRGANIQPMPIINYGLWAIKSGEKQNKALIIPFIFNNEGIKNGLVIDIEVAFKNNEGYQPIEIKRKVVLNDYSEQELRNMNLADFRNKYLSSVHPTYPVHVVAKEGRQVTFEAFDGNEAISIGEQTMCRIRILQQNGRWNAIEFPFFISQEDFDNTINNLTWL